jgi:predicted metal-dependent hydrolase
VGRSTRFGGIARCERLFCAGKSAKKRVSEAELLHDAECFIAAEMLHDGQDASSHPSYFTTVEVLHNSRMADHAWS